MPDRPQQRAAWFLRFRQSRDGQPPAAHLLQAWRQARRLPVIRPRRQLQSASSPATIGGNWTELGPRPETDPSYGAVAGRMTAIAVDTGKDPSGNTVYLGAADGGVWKSTNALAANPTFTPIGDNLPSLAIGAIALDDSTTPTTIYVGTGEPNGSQDSYYGLGIYKSTDGGATWTAGSGVNFFGSAISKLLVDPTSPNILLAAVTEGGVYVNNNLVNSTPAIGIVRSTDGGATWSQVAAFSGHSATDLIYDGNSGKYYAAIRSLGIYVSADQGQTWQALGSPFGSENTTAQNFYRASLAIRNGAIFALVADANGTPTQASDCNGATTCAGLIESANGGATWGALALPANLYGSNNQGDYDQFLAAPANSSLLLVGGIDVWKEDLATPGWANLTNAYTSTALTVHADEHAIAVLSPSTWIVANDGGAWSTANAGASWTDMNASIGAIQFYSVTPDPTTAGRLLGGSQDNGTVLAAAGSLDWPSLFGGDGGHTAINPQNPQRLFTENYNVSVQCFTNGAFDPVVDTTLVSEPTAFYVPYILAPSDPATMYLAGQRVWRGPACPAAANPPEPVDTGWQAISPNLDDFSHAPGLTAAEDDLTAIAAAPGSPDVIYAGAFDGVVSVTTNATVSGATPTWTQAQASLYENFQGPVTAIAVSPADPQTVYWGMGYVGSSAYLYKSSDGGNTAVNIAGNLPGTPINAIVIDPSDPSNVYAATDVGVFVVNDGGGAGGNEIWTRVGDNLPAAAVVSLALTDAGGTPTLIAGTHGRGAWSIPAIAPPGFTMTVSPASLRVEAGQSATVTVQTTAVGGASTIALSCSPNCTASPASIAAGSASTLTVTPSGNVTNVTVTADNTYGQQSQTIPVTLLDFQLSYPTYPPTKATLQLAGSVSQGWTLEDLSSATYDAPITLACPNAPAGITCTFSPASIASLSQTQNGTLTIQASNSAAPGTISLQVSATGGTVTHALPLPLQVSAFALTGPSAPVPAPVGAPASFQVNASSLSGFTGSIALTCSATQGSCAMQPATITAGQSSTATVTGFTAGLPSVGVAVTGTAGASVVTVQASLAPQGIALSLPQMQLVTIPGANSVQGRVTVVGTNGFSSPVALGCSNAAGLQCTVTPATVTPGSSAQVTISGFNQLAQPGSVAVTLTAASGSVTASAVLQAANNGGFTVSATPVQAAYLPGDPVTLQVVYSGINGYQGAIALACGPAPTGASCSINSGQATITGLAQTGTVQVPIVASTSDNGATLTQTVNAAVVEGDFSLQAANPQQTVGPQGSADFQFTVAGTPGLSFPAAPDCVANTYAMCASLNPFTAASGNTFNVVVTATSFAGAPAGGGNSDGWPWGGWLLLLAGGLLLALARKRTRWAAVGLLAVASVACGGGGGGGGGTAPLIQTYPVTITLKDATIGAVNPVKRSVTVQLTVN